MLIKCPYCERNFNFKPFEVESFENRENDFLQNECLKMNRRLDKLKNDKNINSPYKADKNKTEIAALTKILNILESYI